MAVDKKYLAVNPGSASKKYALYFGEQELFQAHFEREGNDFIVTYQTSGEPKRGVLKEHEYDDSGQVLLNILIKEEIITSKQEIAAVGFRIVAPGSYFLETTQLTREYLNNLMKAREEVPLHTASLFPEIKQFLDLLPHASFVAVSDSAFHSGLPEIAKYYALPEKAREHVQRFGYHGISLAWIVRKVGELAESFPENTIICHLGGGSSVTALKAGKSIDTSMGFTPLEGLPMGTRVGDIDAGAVIELGKKMEWDLSTLEQYLYKECGLLGVSGSTNDIRELLSQEKQGDKKAHLALEMFIYKTKKYIGSYVAALGGVDFLVFTGTVGERSAVIRDRICGNMEALGIVLDPGVNARTISAPGFIEGYKATARIAVIPTNEMAQIALETQEFLGYGR